MVSLETVHRCSDVGEDIGSQTILQRNQRLRAPGAQKVRFNASGKKLKPGFVGALVEAVSKGEGSHNYNRSSRKLLIYTTKCPETLGTTSVLSHSSKRGYYRQDHRKVASRAVSPASWIHKTNDHREARLSKRIVVAGLYIPAPPWAYIWGPCQVVSGAHFRGP